MDIWTKTFHHYLALIQIQTKHRKSAKLPWSHNLINLFGQDQSQGTLGGHGGQEGQVVRVLGWSGGRGRQGRQGGQGKGHFVWNSKVAAVPGGYLAVTGGYLAVPGGYLMVPGGYLNKG